MLTASKSKLSYANVVSTIALFLALTGGVVYAASKIATKDIQRQAVTGKKIAPEAVKNGKLAAGAVRPASSPPARSATPRSRTTRSSPRS